MPPPKKKKCVMLNPVGADLPLCVQVPQREQHQVHRVRPDCPLAQQAAAPRHGAGQTLGLYIHG